MWRLVLLSVLAIFLLHGCAPHPLKAVSGPYAQTSEAPRLTVRSGVLQGGLPKRDVWIAGVAVTRPFVFYSPEQETPQGLDVELIEEIARRNGAQVQWVEMAFAALIPAVIDGKIDLAAGAMYITPERSQAVNFATPYLDTGLVMVIPPRLEGQVRQASDLAGLRVGVKFGATGAELAQKLQQQGIDFQVVQYKNTLESLLDLEVGRLDVVLNDYLNTSAYLSDGKSTLLMARQVDGDVTFLSHGQLGIAVSKEDPILLDQVNRSLQEIRQEKILSSLARRWLGLAIPDD